MVSTLARVHHQHPSGLRPLQRAPRRRSPLRHPSLPRPHRLRADASIPGFRPDGSSPRNRTSPPLRRTPPPARRSHLLLRRRTPPHRRFRRRSVRRHRPRRRPGSPSPHPNHPRRSWRIAHPKSCRRSQSQASLIPRCSRQPAQVQIHPRTASVRRPALFPHRAQSRRQRDRSRTQPRPRSIPRQPHPQQFHRAARPQRFLQ